MESTAKLRDEIKALSGVDIMKDATTFKSTYQILDELADVWDSLTDISQASLLEIISGKQRGSAVSAMLQNWDVAERALETAAKLNWALPCEKTPLMLNLLKATLTSWPTHGRKFGAV